MHDTVIGQIQNLQRMTVAELRVRWRELYGEESRSRNRDFLWRRLAWRVQELACGGLSDRARTRLEELGADGFRRARVPQQAPTEVNVGVPTEAEDKVVPIRDPRRPVPGTVLSRSYHGQEIRVVAHEDGFEWDGRRFDSLSEVARAITGQHWSGPLFFGLRKRSRRS